MKLLSTWSTWSTWSRWVFCLFSSYKLCTSNSINKQRRSSDRRFQTIYVDQIQHWYQTSEIPSCFPFKRRNARSIVADNRKCNWSKWRIWRFPQTQQINSNHQKVSIVPNSLVKMVFPQIDFLQSNFDYQIDQENHQKFEWSIFGGRFCWRSLQIKVGLSCFPNRSNLKKWKVYRWWTTQASEQPSIQNRYRTWNSLHNRLIMHSLCKLLQRVNSLLNKSV